MFLTPAENDLHNSHLELMEKILPYLLPALWIGGSTGSVVLPLIIPNIYGLLLVAAENAQHQILSTWVNVQREAGSATHQGQTALFFVIVSDVTDFFPIRVWTGIEILLCGRHCAGHLICIIIKLILTEARGLDFWYKISIIKDLV